MLLFVSDIPVCAMGPMFLAFCAAREAAIISPSFMGQVWESDLRQELRWRLEADYHHLQYIILHITDFYVGCDTYSKFSVDSYEELSICNKNKPVYPIRSKLSVMNLYFKYELPENYMFVEGFEAEYRIKSKAVNMSSLVSSEEMGKWLNTFWLDTLGRKILLPKGSEFFPFRVDPCTGVVQNYPRSALEFPNSLMAPHGKNTYEQTLLLYDKSKMRPRLQTLIQYARKLQ